MKYFRMSYEEVVFKRSYLNLLLLNAAIPSIKPMTEDDKDYSINNKSRRNNSNKKSYVTNDNGNSFFASLM